MAITVKLRGEMKYKLLPIPGWAILLAALFTFTGSLPLFAAPPISRS